MKHIELLAAIGAAPSYPEWLLARLVDLRCARRRDQWRRYDANEKGRVGNAHYYATPAGIARKLLYEQTIRAAMRAPYYIPRPIISASPLDVPMSFIGRDGLRGERNLFDERADYAETIRRERAAGTLSPLTLGQLLGSSK